MMLPPGPLSEAAGDISVAASMVRPMGINSAVSAFVVVATVGVSAVLDTDASTVTTSVNDASVSFTLTGSRSAIFKLTVRFTVAKPWSSHVTV